MKFSKKAVVLLLLSFFSLSAFAAPGGNGAGGNRGKSSKPGSSRPTPSNSRPARPSSPSPRPGSSSSRSSSHFSSPQKEKPQQNSSSASHSGSSSESSSQTSEAPDSSNSSRTDKNQESKNDKNNFSMQSESQPQNDENQIQDSQISAPEIIYYRGTRTLSENGTFALQQVKSERLNPSEVSLEITFSQSVNPLTFTEESLLLWADGEQVSSKTKFSFNKKGDTIRVSVPLSAESEKLTFSIQNVKSFDGTPIESFSPITIQVR